MTQQAKTTEQIMMSERLKDLAISDSGFVFDPYSGATYNANVTALRLLRGLRAGRSADELADELAGDCLLAPEEALRDVADFIQQLRSCSLIEA